MKLFIRTMIALFLVVGLGSHTAEVLAQGADETQRVLAAREFDPAQSISLPCGAARLVPLGNYVSDTLTSDVKHRLAAVGELVVKASPNAPLVKATEACPATLSKLPDGLVSVDNPLLIYDLSGRQVAKLLSVAAYDHRDLSLTSGVYILTYRLDNAQACSIPFMQL